MYIEPRIKLCYSFCAVFIYEVRPSFTSLYDIAVIPLYSFLPWPFSSLSYPFLFLLSFLSLSFILFGPSFTSHLIVVRVYNTWRWSSLLLQPPPFFWLLLQLLLVLTSTLMPWKNGVMVCFFSPLSPSWTTSKYPIYLFIDLEVVAPNEDSVVVAGGLAKVTVSKSYI